jgi:hypothetical protein
MTTRGFSLILLLADSLNCFRHVGKHLIRIHTFVVLADGSHGFEEARFGNGFAGLLHHSILLRWLHAFDAWDSVKIPIKTDNLGKMKLLHHDNVVGVSK